jgi:hypothetical protein
MQQLLLQALGDSDDDNAGGEASPDEKPAGRRAKKAKRDEDSDFEVSRWLRETLRSGCGGRRGKAAA